MLTGVANFLGACRDTENGYEGYAVWLMWEYVEGRTFDEYAAAPSRADRELVNAAREVRPHNRFAPPAGNRPRLDQREQRPDRPVRAIRLTHVSPLLYNDAAEDAKSTVEMLWSIV